MRSIAGVNLRNVPRSDVKRNVCALHCANNVGVSEKNFGDPPPGAPGRPAGRGGLFRDFDPPPIGAQGGGRIGDNAPGDIEKSESEWTGARPGTRPDCPMSPASSVTIGVPVGDHFGD